MKTCLPIDRIIERKSDIRDWLDEAAAFTSIDQRHLTADAVERAYWHHGYHAALDEVVRLLTCADQADTPCSAAGASPSPRKCGSH